MLQDKRGAPGLISEDLAVDGFGCKNVSGGDEFFEEAARFDELVIVDGAGGDCPINPIARQIHPAARIAERSRYRSRLGHCGEGVLILSFLAPGRARNG